MKEPEDLAIAKLMLDIQAPVLEDCWEEGFQVSSTQDLEENPYKKHTANYYHWQEGWWAGKFSPQEERVILSDSSNSIFEEEYTQEDIKSSKEGKRSLIHI